MRTKNRLVGCVLLSVLIICLSACQQKQTPDNTQSIDFTNITLNSSFSNFYSLDECMEITGYFKTTVDCYEKNDNGDFFELPKDDALEAMKQYADKISEKNPNKSSAELQSLRDKYLTIFVDIMAIQKTMAEYNLGEKNEERYIACCNTVDAKVNYILDTYYVNQK